MILPRNPAHAAPRAARRRRQVIAAGHTGQAGSGAPGAATTPIPRCRPRRSGPWPASALSRWPTSPAPWPGRRRPVRRRATDAALSVRGPRLALGASRARGRALADPDPLVVVGAAWFLAERRVAAGRRGPGCDGRATHHDVRCREAAVAALGAIGDPRGLPAVIGALDDKPTVRRRATVALAGFDDPRVEPALRRSAEDRDWQVRQAADELLADDG